MLAAYFNMLQRDVDNMAHYFGRFAPELLDSWYGEEMWALFEAGDLLPDSPLTGTFVHDETTIDLDSVRHAINDAREEALIRQQGREAAEEIIGVAVDLPVDRANPS